MQSGESQNPDLRDILKQAQQEGANKRHAGAESGRHAFSQLKEGLRTRIDSARNRVNEFRTGIQNTGRSLAEVSKNIIDTSIGMASNSENRKVLGNYMESKAANARDAMDAKAYAIRENAFNKAENTLLSAQNRMHEAVQNAQNNFRSDVAEAQAIARGIQNGGREVVSFFRNQGEQAVNNTMANMYDSIADFRNLQASKDRIISRVFGGVASFFQERTDKSNDRINNRTAQSTNLNSTANALRMRPAPAGA